VRTVRFAPVRPPKSATRRWIGRSILLGKIGRWTGVAFGACITWTLAIIIGGIAAIFVLQILAAIFSHTT
jgi:hypothetical protein